MFRRILSGAAVGLAVAALALWQQPASLAAQTARSTAPTSIVALDDAACGRLGASLKLPDTTITGAAVVPAGSFTPPRGRALNNLPAFCRIAATSQPAVRFEVWLPQTTWNRKFQVVGNGANAGSISYDAMATALRRGYAVASTDTGHATTNSRDAAWALGHPELIEDFSYRALHLTTVHGKTIVQQSYASAPTRSYYVGCSTGGRQGMMESQRYPDDFDGIVAGAPAANWTHFQAGGHLWAFMALNKDPESYIPASKLPIIETGVNDACDANDGRKDGILEDPRQCHFNASALVCKAGQDPNSCLTVKQAAAVNAIWTGAKNSRGEQIYPPYMRGAEAQGGWQTYTTGTGPGTGSHYDQASNTLGYMLFQNPKWDWRSFDFDRDIPMADQKMGALMNAFDPDLTKMRQHGAKLLLYHGWNDPSISPLNTIDYYEQAVATWRTQTKQPADSSSDPDFIRLFLVPGMLHCSGGPGADRFDAVSALERWVEQGQAPNELEASHVQDGKPTFTRPLCAYPRAATYDAATGGWRCGGKL